MSKLCYKRGASIKSYNLKDNVSSTPKLGVKVGTTTKYLKLKPGEKAGSTCIKINNTKYYIPDKPYETCGIGTNYADPVRINAYGGNQTGQGGYGVLKTVAGNNSKCYSDNCRIVFWPITTDGETVVAGILTCYGLISKVRHTNRSLTAKLNTIDYNFARGRYNDTAGLSFGPYILYKIVNFTYSGGSNATSNSTASYVQDAIKSHAAWNTSTLRDQLRAKVADTISAGRDPLAERADNSITESTYWMMDSLYENSNISKAPSSSQFFSFRCYQATQTSWMDWDNLIVSCRISADDYNWGGCASAYIEFPGNGLLDTAPLDVIDIWYNEVGNRATFATGGYY